MKDIFYYGYNDGYQAMTSDQSWLYLELTFQ